MLRAVPDWKLVQLVSSSLTSFGPKAIKGRSKFSTEATLVVVMVVWVVMVVEAFHLLEYQM